MPYDIVIRFCWIVITICIASLTVYLFSTLRRLNRILKDVEEVTGRVRPVVRFLSNALQTGKNLMKVLSFFRARRTKNRKGDKNG